MLEQAAGIIGLPKDRTTWIGCRLLFFAGAAGILAAVPVAVLLNFVNLAPAQAACGGLLLWASAELTPEEPKAADE
jgi:hypothetical protein